MYKLYKIYTYVCIHTSISVMKNIYLYIYKTFIYRKYIIYKTLKKVKKI